MEEAYTALYQEFLRLRSICLRQAAMLQHLTKAPDFQQGRNGDSENLVSVPVECTQDDLINFYSDAHGLMVHRQALEQPAETKTTHGGGGVSIDLLNTGVEQLQLTPAQPQSQAPLGACAESGHVGPLSTPRVNLPKGPPSIIDDLRRAEQQWAENNPTRERRPWSSSSFLDSEWLSLAGSRLMSRVTLQSQVCEFCQAVFPGNTTTRGEFLRHLTSHIT